MEARNLEEVVVVMDRIVERYREAQSPLGFFAAMYRSVTLRVHSAVQRGEFVDSARMDRFATVFANRYFTALAAALGNQKPPRAWQVAIQAEARPNTMILQHLLLGMNAHINYDLPIAALMVAPGAALPELEPDFRAIGGILAAMLDPVQAVVNRFSPLLDLLDRVGGRSDETLVTFSVNTARGEAWHEANRLACEPEALRERSLQSLDRRVTLLAERIIIPGGPCGLAIDLIARTEHPSVSDITDALLGAR